MDFYIGTILPWAMEFAPRGWAICDGRLLPINQYQAVFALLGTRYGGNGSTNFALPNLVGRVPVGYGSTAWRQSYPLGISGGQDTVTLTASQLPSHTHSIPASNAPADQSTPGVDKCFAQAMDSDGNTVNAYTNAQNTQLMTAGLLGAVQAHENRQPYLAINYIICLEGIFPVRE